MTGKNPDADQRPAVRGTGGAGQRPAVRAASGARRALLKTVEASVFVLLMTLAATASADERSLIVGYQPAWFVLAGGTGGASFGTDENGGYLGAELSVARMFRGWWYGLYGDAYYDFGTKIPTASVGPEFGFWIVGVDGGVGFRPASETGIEVGPTVRPMLTLGVLTVYYRHAFWPGATENRTVQQIGVLLKVPIGAAWGTGPTPPTNMGRSRSKR